MDFNQRMSVVRSSQTNNQRKKEEESDAFMTLVLAPIHHSLLANTDIEL